MSTIFDEFAQTIKELRESVGEVKSYEVWITEHMPDTGLDGEPLVLGFNFREAEKPYFGFRDSHGLLQTGYRGYLPETTDLVLVSPATFEKIKDDTFAAGIPVFRSGGVRVLPDGGESAVSRAYRAVMAEKEIEETNQSFFKREKSE